jgi:GNAT superfamily N-acetyltransferase
MQIAQRPPADPDALQLLHAFHTEQMERYGFADPIDVDSGEYVPPNGVFVVLYRDAVPVGCGGYRWFDRKARIVEIKRGYVIPASRGHGAGRALLSWLEQHAIAAGARRAILETGVRNTAALSLFASAGYQPVNRYVEGRDPKINRAFARYLTSAQPPS